MSQPTPFPVTPIVTREPDIPALDQNNGEIIPALAAIQYGVLPNTVDFLPLEQLESATIEINMISDLSIIERFDVVTGYGVYDGWTSVPTKLAPFSIVINPGLAPLNNPEAIGILHSAIQPKTIVEQLGIPGIEILTDGVDAKTTREALANMGYPDGFTIYGKAANLPGTSLIVETLETVNITLVILEDDVPLENLHIHIQQLDETGRQTYDQNQIIDLFILPISYIARDDIQTAFTKDGWVIATR